MRKGLWYNIRSVVFISLVIIVYIGNQNIGILVRCTSIIRLELVQHRATFGIYGPNLLLFVSMNLDGPHSKHSITIYLFGISTRLL